MEHKVALTSIFKNLLMVENIDVNTDLKTYGLNSLQAAGAAMLARNSGIKITPSDILKYKSIESLLKNKTEEDKPEKPVENSIEQAVSFPFTPTQRSWQDGGFLEHYNIYSAWEITTETLSLEQFSQAIKIFCRSQKEMQLSIYRENGNLKRKFDENLGEAEIEHIDLSHVPDEEKQATLIKLTTEMQYQFKFEEGEPLYRFVVFDFDGCGQGILFILVHHYMIDGFGFGNLLQRLSTIYKSIQQGRTPVRADLGSGEAKLWAEHLVNYARSTAKEELKFWKGLPWLSINKDMRTGITPALSTYSDPTLFSEDGAQKLCEYQEGKQFIKSDLDKVFSNQATVIDYLDEDTTEKFLGCNWNQYGFSDFDIFSVAAANALKEYYFDDYVWLDMLAAVRGDIFEDIDVSSSVGYISELTPYLVNCKLGNNKSSVTQLAKQRSETPHSGLGLRALKYYGNESNVEDVVSEMRLPQSGINYRASLQYTISNTLLDLPIVNFGLGPTMDERGIPYKFWFRVSYSSSKLEIVLRYDPRSYELTDAKKVVKETKSNLIELLKGINII